MPNRPILISRNCFKVKISALLSNPLNRIIRKRHQRGRLALLNVGIAGLGRMGKLHLLNALGSRGIKVVGAADSLKSNQEFARRHNVKVYGDYRAMLDDGNLDAVVISLPNFLKKESLFYAFERHVPAFVDKPLARSLREAKDIDQKAQAANARLMVGVNYRYFDSIQRLKKTTDEGRIGDVVLATSELIMDGPFAHQLVPKPISEWWLDKESSGGGVLLDLGYHLVDLFCWMFGELELEFSVLEYRYGLPVEDSATVVLRSATSGTRCSINVGWFSKMIFPNFNFRVNLHGTVGYLSSDRFAPANMYINAAKEGVKNIVRKALGKEINRLSYTYYYASFPIILDQFFESIRCGSDMPVTMQEQLMVMQTIDCAYKQQKG